MKTTIVNGNSDLNIQQRKKTLSSKNPTRIKDGGNTESSGSTTVILTARVGSSVPPDKDPAAGSQNSATFIAAKSVATTGSDASTAPNNQDTSKYY
jgi:hypothetical protein